MRKQGATLDVAAIGPVGDSEGDGSGEKVG
jgi:hypothetical protein